MKLYIVSKFRSCSFLLYPWRDQNGWVFQVNNNVFRRRVFKQFRNLGFSTWMCSTQCSQSENINLKYPYTCVHQINGNKNWRILSQLYL